MTTWLRMLKGDPLPWLLEEDTPAVRHLALRQLLDQPEDAPEVRQARAAAMQTDPMPPSWLRNSQRGSGSNRAQDILPSTGERSGSSSFSTSLEPMAQTHVCKRRATMCCPTARPRRGDLPPGEGGAGKKLPLPHLS
jgi:hypothetical protein